MPECFVLVHGAFRGGWAWDRVSEILRAAGHTVWTPDAVSAHAVVSRAPLTLDDMIGRVVDAVEVAAADHASLPTLAGHSFGGFLARAAAEHCAGQLRELAYIDAPVPRDGERGYGFPGSDRPAPSVPADAWAEPPLVRSGPDMSNDDADWINARLRPEPMAASCETARLTSAEAAAVPARHLFFTRTPDFMACIVTRGRLETDDVPYQQIEAGHDGIVTAADEVAAWLVDVDEDRVSPPAAAR